MLSVHQPPQHHTEARAAQDAVATTPVPTSSEINQTFQVVAYFTQTGQVRQAIDILKEFMDRVVVHVEALGLAHSRPHQATNPNSIYNSLPTPPSAIVPNTTLFWNQVNVLFLRLLVALRAQHTVAADWDWIHENVMGWAENLRWFGLVDYELGFWAQDIVKAIQAGKAMSAASTRK
ncbi:hypothetical protein HDU98_011026 [Podochytrium sp. JEL0797]|nr:hypothetical protein HDU98_011026 [Podochytrium sp. JEL0797]